MCLYAGGTVFMTCMTTFHYSMHARFVSRGVSSAGRAERCTAYVHSFLPVTHVLSCTSSTLCALNATHAYHHCHTPHTVTHTHVHTHQRRACHYAMHAAAASLEAPRHPRTSHLALTVASTCAQQCTSMAEATTPCPLTALSSSQTSSVLSKIHVWCLVCFRAHGTANVADVCDFAPTTPYVPTRVTRTRAVVPVLCHPISTCPHTLWCSGGVGCRDQRMWQQPLSGTSPPTPVTAQGQGLRFSDYVYDTRHKRVIAVCEQHKSEKEVVNSVVAIGELGRSGLSATVLCC